MSDVTRLKNRARREEQRENWSGAIELYTKALSESQQRADSISDVSLYNRIGDIYLRIGQKNTAVRYYEEAIEQYAEHELHASAIALCNKVLRIHAGRSSIYLQLGRLHLATNLVADAHAHYLRYAKSMREFGDDEAALDGLEELIDATGEAKIVELWREYLSSAIVRDAAEERVEAFRGALTSHGFDSDAILASVREADRGADSTPPPATDLDEVGPDAAAEEDVVPLPLLEDQAADPEALPVFTVVPTPEDQEPLQEESSIPLEEGSFLDEVGSGASAEAMPDPNESGSGPGPDSDDEVPKFLEGESTPWEVDDEEAGVWQSDIDGPAVGGPADWEAEPVLDGVEPPAGAPRTAPDAPGSGPRDVCEAPVLEPHEDEILLVASSDGIEPSLDLEPGLAGVGGYASDTPERTVMRPGSGQPKAPEGRLDGSEALIVSGHLGVVRGPSVDQVERSIESGLTTLTWRAPEGEPCEVLEDVGPAVRPMPFEAEAGEDHAVDGFARAGEDGDAPPNMLATPDMLETIEGAISSDASDDERLNLRETLAGTPEPADLELPEVDLRYGLEPLELTAATEGPEESDAHGPHAESIEASEVEADATTALEVGLEQMLATQQDAAAARGDQRDESGLETAEVEEAFLDTAEVEEPVADSQEVEDVESFAFEVYELEAPGGATDEPVEASPSLTSEDADVPEVELEAQEVELEVQEVELEAPEAEAGVAEHAAAASYQDPGAGEPDLEEVDFDPDVSEVEVEVEVTESWPESAEPRPVTPLADSSSLTEPATPEPERDTTPEPEREGVATASAQVAPTTEGLSTSTAEATLSSEEEEEDAFREWVASASSPILRRALTELELRAELDKVLLVVEKLLELDASEPALHRKRVEYLAVSGNEPLIATAFMDLGLCLEQAGEMLEACAAYEDLLKIDPGNVVAASALQRHKDIAGQRAEQEEAADSADPIQDMRERAVMGGGSPTPGYMHPDLVRGGVVDPPGEDVPRPYSGVSGGREAGADFDQLLSEFRAELHERPQSADSLTRTELGASLKEMGRLDDAIRELQAAVREPQAPALAYELLGEAFLDKGQARVAMRLLKQALDDGSWDDREMLGVLYQLGISYQELDELPSALGCYERIFSVDIDYKDVQDRILSCS